MEQKNYPTRLLLPKVHLHLEGFLKKGKQNTEAKKEHKRQTLFVVYCLHSIMYQLQIKLSNSLKNYAIHYGRIKLGDVHRIFLKNFNTLSLSNCKQISEITELPF